MTAISPASWRSGRHSAAPARSACFRRVADEALRSLVGPMTPFLCHSPDPREKRPQPCGPTTIPNQSRKGRLARSQRLSEDRACACLAPRPRSTVFLDASWILRPLAMRSTMRRRAAVASTSMTLADRSRSTYTFRELREDALVHARRFIALGIKPGDRVALVAETGADFAACFFGAVYAGAWPVPLPLPTSFGGREAYVDQLEIQLKSCDPEAFAIPGPARGLLRSGRNEGRRRAARLGIAGRSRTGAGRPAEGQPGRHRLSPIFERLDALPARRRGHAPRASRQFARARHRPSGARHRPLRLLAAVVPRHGPGRLSPFADRPADVGRLSEDRRFRAPSACMARHDHAQSGHDASATRRRSATTSARAG